MLKISTGINDLDNLIDSAHIGDNVVWETEAGTSEDIFIRNFIETSLADNRDVIYVSFNRSPQSILLHLNLSEAHLDKLTILDCFTAGKGKSDRAFLKFYETRKTSVPGVMKVDRPNDISAFSETINALQDRLPEGARYIFDSLTGMQDLWGDENSTYKFFTYTCPRLYDLRTIAYWMLEKEAHSQPFKANLRHITQVVIELYKKKDKLFLKALKLEGRSSREAFKPHSYEIEGNEIFIAPVRKEPALNIGDRIREMRVRLGMSQKDLAEKVGLTSSFISQLENNQISPSLNSFLQITDALSLNPSILLQKEKPADSVRWLITHDAALKNPVQKHDGYSLYSVFAHEKLAAYLATINPGAEIHKHFLSHKKEEVIHIVKGSIAVTIDTVEKVLTQGDSVHLKDSMPSMWKNTSGEEVESFIVCT